MHIRIAFLLCLAAGFSSCARNFTRPDFTAVPYTAAGSMESRLDFDVTQEGIALPEPFMKKLNKKNIVLHAVRVRNYTADTLWLRAQEVQLFSSGRSLPVLPSKQVYKALKQPVAVHALWFLLGPFIRTDKGETRLDYHPLGVGAVSWGTINGIVAYKSNREVKEMLHYTMPSGDTPIAPGGTLYLLKPLAPASNPRTLELRYAELTENR